MVSTLTGGLLSVYLLFLAIFAASTAAPENSSPEVATDLLPHCSADDERCHAEDHAPALVELLQMGLQVSGMAQANASLYDAGALEVNKSALDAKMDKSAFYAGVNKSAVAGGIGQDVPDCAALWFRGAQPTPLMIQSDVRFLETLGYKHQFQPCQEIIPVGADYNMRRPAWRGYIPVKAVPDSSSGTSIPPALWGFGAYIGIIMVMLLRMLYMLLRPSSVQQPKNLHFRPESTAYSSGFVSWLSISWVTPWICKYGSSYDPATTKVKPEDLGKPGWADYEADNTVETFEKMWKEDIAKRGSQGTNLYIVIAKFCTFRKILQLSLMVFIFEAFGALGPTLCVDWTLTYMQNLQMRAAIDPSAANLENQLPVVIAIVGMYTGVPLFMCIANTVGMLIGSRLFIRLQSALLAAVYRKAQRMPFTGSSYDLSDPLGDQVAQTRVGDGGTAINGKNYSLVQLCNTDINANLLNFQFILAKVFIEIPILGGLVALMFWKMGKSAFLVFGIVLASSFVLMWLTRQLFIRYGWFQILSGGRLAFMQEVMHSIRMMKCNAYEPVAHQILADCRIQECSQLTWYYFWMGMNLVILYVYPKIVAIGGLAGFESMSGEIKAADVFVMVQILGAFRGVAHTLLTTIPAIVGFVPSIQRIDRMLKLPEANLAGMKTDHVEKKWLSLWPAQDQLFTGGTTTDVKPTLRLQGTFLWSENGKEALSGISMHVQQGEMVAIMGEVGCGKSTLLAAMLGELAPTQDSRLEIPERIAYHAQVPVISEASLKENVLYYSDYDEKRYQEALREACLLPDLQILPGGDAVMIGSRGISLSGGQRARVSLARAAYASNAPAVLIDDPFGSVDVPTGRHLMDNLLNGPLLKDRARVVVCQPDRQRVKMFDRVYIMSEGKVVAAGVPDEVLKTPEYQALLSKYEATMLLEELEAGVQQNDTIQVNSGNYERTVNNPVAQTTAVSALRDEEHEGRADSTTIHYFLAMGGYSTLIASGVFLVFFVVFTLLSDLVLVRWSNKIMVTMVLGIPSPSSTIYLVGCAVWFIIAMICFVSHWITGNIWTIRISGNLHNIIIHRLLGAPIDRFFDKTPVGRIMNRMTFDMTDIDLQMFYKFQGVIGQGVMYIIPLVYVHYVMPTYLLMGSIPFYYLLYLLISQYWNTMVPLRYLNSVTRSNLNAYITEVEHDTVMSRAYQVSNVVSKKEMAAADEMIKVEYANMCVSRWTTNRVLITYSMFGTIVAAIGVLFLVKQQASVGTVGLCLSHLSMIIMGSEAFLQQMTDAQFQFISMNRLHEYTMLPEEKDARKPTDGRFFSPMVHVAREALGSLLIKRQDTRLQIWKKQGLTGEELLLEQMPDHQAFKPPAGKTLMILDPTNPVLHYTADWHRVYSVNGICRDAAAMAEDMVNGTNQSVWLGVRSGWLHGGARVQLTDLVVGYADLPQNVLQGVNLTIEPRSKTAIAGSTGCGKSTTILAIMRLLEPRGGKVEINGVNIQTIGLRTLRESMGLVPQDPVLFSGTIRNNLDPFSQYTDPEVWSSLRAVQLFDFVTKTGVGLDMYIKADGDNLSFGQKQLICIARQILRNPELLLLDECTSAIDPHTQEMVQDTIRTGFPDSTLVAIAHRLETIMDFDTVIVLDRGHVVEKGLISELSQAKGGWFAKMLHAKDR